MKYFNFTRIFGNNNATQAAAKASKKRKGRTLRIEELENREMLAVMFGTGGIYDDVALIPTPDSVNGGTAWVSPAHEVEIEAHVSKLKDEFSPHTFNEDQYKTLVGIFNDDLRGPDKNNPNDDLSFDGAITWEIVGGEYVVVGLDFTAGAVSHLVENFTTLDLSVFTNLNTLVLTEHNSGTGETTGVTNLKSLNISGTKIEELDVRNTQLDTFIAADCTELRDIKWDAAIESSLITLDISGCVELLEGNYAPDTLDLFGNLTRLMVADLDLGGLDISALTNLEYLDISGNTFLFSEYKTDGGLILPPGFPGSGSILKADGITLWAEDEYFEWRGQNHNVVSNIDLSKELQVPGTTITWYSVVGSIRQELEVGTDYTVSDRTFTFNFDSDKLPAGATVYGVLKNPNIPFDLRTDELTVVKKLDAPITWSADPIDANTVRLAWGAVEGATEGYMIEWREVSGNWNWSNRKDVNNGTTTVDIEGLSTDTTYEFRVFANAVPGRHLVSDTSSFGLVKTLAAGQSALGSPVLGDTVATRTTLKVTWEEVKDASGYTIEWSDDGGKTWTAPVSVGSSSTNGEVSYTITDLKAGTLYHFRVVATAATGQTDVVGSASTYGEKETAAPIPITPPTVTVSETTHNSIRINWTAPAPPQPGQTNNGVTGYRVELFAAGAATPISVHTASLSNTTLTHTFTGLSADTSYEVRVTAIGGGEYVESSPSLRVSAKTQIDPAMAMGTGIKIENVSLTTTTATLSVRIPGEATDADWYAVRYQVSEGNDDWETWGVPMRGDWLKGNTVHITITGLTAGTLYDFQVVKGTSGEIASLLRSNMAVSGDIEKLQKTLEKPAVDAAKPSKLRATTTISSSVTLTWNTPTPDAEYLIEVTNRSTGAPVAIFDLEGAEYKDGKIRITGNGVVINGLDQNTRYRFTVIALNKDGERSVDAKGRENSVSISATTKRYAAVSGLKATAGVDSITLTWRPHSHPETEGYVIEVKDSSGKEMLAVIRIDNNKTVSVKDKNGNDITNHSVSFINSTSIEIAGLGKTDGVRERYTFTVRAATDTPIAGTDKVVESRDRTIKVRTASYGKVGSVQAVVGAGFVSLQWRDSRAAETDYYEISSGENMMIVPDGATFAAVPREWFTTGRNILEIRAVVLSDEGKDEHGLGGTLIKSAVRTVTLKV